MRADRRPLEPQDPIATTTRERLQDDPRAHVVGDVSDTAPWYTIFDLVALPTYREGFPNVPLEAASMELPVVATSVPGCVDAVEDGVTGTLVPSHDPRSLHDAITRYLDAPGLRRAHGRAGRERVIRAFRQEDIWEATYAEYARLLQEHHRQT